jgi:hypothetical protein
MGFAARMALASHPANIVMVYMTARTAQMNNTVVSPLPSEERLLDQILSFLPYLFGSSF